MTTPSIHPARRRVVIAGGGIAALEALVALRTLAPDDFDVTLVSPGDSFHYRAADVDEPFGRGRARSFALAPLTSSLGTALVRDAVAEVHGHRHAVTLRSGRELEYDSLLLALGALRYPAYTNGISFDRERDPDVLQDLLDDIDTQFVRNVAVVVPERVEWTLAAYELALSTAAFGRRPLGREIAVTLVTHEGTPLAAFGTTVSREVDAFLAREGIEFVGSANAVVIDERALIAGGRWVTADRIVALPQLAGPRPRGVPCDGGGFIEVDRHGRVPGLDGVYAAGDGTVYPIKQGGLASQQADSVVSHMLCEAGISGSAQPFEPVLRGVLIGADGPLWLESQLAGPPGAGAVTSREPLWAPAGRVASRWLGPFLDGFDRRPMLAATA